jgi:hypothetical protein
MSMDFLNASPVSEDPDNDLLSLKINKTPNDKDEKVFVGG